MSDTPDLTPEASAEIIKRLQQALFGRALYKGGVIGQTIEASMRSTFYQLSAFDIHEAWTHIEALAAELAAARELIEVLEAEQDRADKAESERDAAIAALDEAARLRGEAEGKLLATEIPWIMEGWKRRAQAAEAERDALAGRLATARDDALEEAASEMELGAHVMSHHGSHIEVKAYQNAAKAIRAMKGGI